MDLQSMPVDILEHILLQVDSPICLVRSSATCKLWRRLITGAVFLRRIRSLHEPPVVGSYSNNNLSITSRPRYEPAPPPTTIASRHISVKFLRNNKKKGLSKWTVKDSSGSLLLLQIDVVKESKHHLHMFVCEPLTRRLEKVASTTTASPPRSKTEAFLLEGPEPGGIGMSNFRVVRLSRHGSMAGIFTSGGSYCKVKTGNNQGKEMRCIGFAAGSMYWCANEGRAVLAMDQSTAEFSSSSLPDIADFAQPITVSSKFAVTTGGDGEASILFLGAGDELKIFARQKKGSTDWVLERSVRIRQLSLGVPASQELILGRSVPLSAETMGTVQILASRGKIEVTTAFNLDIGTMQLTRTKHSTKAYPIRLQFPTSLRACTTAGHV